MPLDNSPSNAASEGPESGPLDILADIATDMLDRDDSDTWPPVVVNGLLKIKDIAAVTIWRRSASDEPIESISSKVCRDRPRDHRRRDDHGVVRFPTDHRNQTRP